MIKKFDKEYSTQYVPEMKYLKLKGINYSFVKDVQGITTYKHTKTPELFSTLVSFYMENKQMKESIDLPIKIHKQIILSYTLKETNIMKLEAL